MPRPRCGMTRKRPGPMGRSGAGPPRRRDAALISQRQAPCAMLTGATAAVAAALVAAAVAAADGPGPLTAYAQAPGADEPLRHGLDGMQLDGLSSGGGHAVLLEFAARKGASSADAAADYHPLQQPSLERGWARTASGLHALDGGASVMVTGGGSIAVHSADHPVVVFAVPAAGGSGGLAGDRYAVTVHAPDGSGGLEATVFEAVLGAGRGGGAENGSAAGLGPDEAAGDEAAGDEAAGGTFPGALALAATITDRVQFGGTLVVQGRVYDASINSDPRVVPRGPGAVPDVPVSVAVTDKRTGQVVLDWAGRADAAGLFRAEHRWSNTDPASALAVAISIDGGRLVEERTAFYMGR